MAKNANERQSGPRLTIYAPKEEQEAIFQAAEALGMSRSQFVRAACDEAIRSRFVRGELDRGPSTPLDFDELEKLWAARMKLAVLQMRQDFEMVFVLKGGPEVLGHPRQKGLLDIEREKRETEHE